MKVDLHIDGFGVSKDCLEYFDGQELGKEIFLLKKELIVLLAISFLKSLRFSSLLSSFT